MTTAPPTTPEKTVDCSCYVVLEDPKRAALYAGIFEGDKVPITTPCAVGVVVDGESFDAYFLDKERVTAEQRMEIAMKASFAFKLPLQEVLNDLMSKENNCPIKAENTTAHFCPFHAPILEAVGLAMAHVRGDDEEAQEYDERKADIDFDACDDDDNDYDGVGDWNPY